MNKSEPILGVKGFWAEPYNDKAGRELLRHGVALMAVALLFAFGVGRAEADSIPEPATVLYGKIIGTGSLQPFLVTEGELEWTIDRPEGGALVLRTGLWPVNDGTYSYRLDVPHEALALDLQTSSAALPLGQAPRTYRHLKIAVNGQPASIVGENGDRFDVAQASRASSYRLDLKVSLEAEDSDGDGIPDWWEEKHGLDKQDGGDAGADLDGDGMSNLQEYREGSDATRDSREPELVTTRLLVYPESVTGLLFEARDADSSPDQLTYTLLKGPDNGDLVLRSAVDGPTGGDLSLRAGDQFTQRNVDEGRLVFAAGELTDAPGRLEVRVEDESPEHDAASGTVTLNVYQPPTVILESGLIEDPIEVAKSGFSIPGMAREESRRLKNYLLAKELGYTVWELADRVRDRALRVPTSDLDPDDYRERFVERFGEAPSHLITGTPGDDRLFGGMEADILVAGEGQDVLRGGGGSDRFLFEAANPDGVTIRDFDPTEADAIDLAAILNGSSPWARDYVRLSESSDGITIGIDSDGSGLDYSDMVLAVDGAFSGGADLHEWVGNDRLLLGDLTLLPRVSVTATKPIAAENGPEAGELTFVRSGSAASELSVRLAIEGAASNGNDYSRLAETVTFPAGGRKVVRPVKPFADSEAEPSEHVEVTILEGENYRVGAESHASVVIEDLEPVVSIEVLKPLATLSPPASATLLVTRSALIDRSVLVRLELDGSAVNGVDYETISGFVNFLPQQTTALIEVDPLPDALSDGRAKSAVVTIASDSSYRLGAKVTGRVRIVGAATTFSDWRARAFPDSDGAIGQFASGDPGDFGISNLQRYAFGLDPQQPDRARLPKIVVRDGRLTMDVWRRPNATDLELIVEASSDLKEWKRYPDGIEKSFPEDRRDDAGFVRYQTTGSADPGQMFMRLRVLRKP